MHDLRRGDEHPRTGKELRLPWHRETPQGSSAYEVRDRDCALVATSFSMHLADRIVEWANVNQTPLTRPDDGGSCRECGNATDPEYTSGCETCFGDLCSKCCLTGLEHQPER